MHNIDLLLTLTGGLTAALALGYITQRIGLSPIVGYLLAGIVVGPHTPGFVGDRQIANELAELGVVLLMFGVGLQFHFKELLAVRRVAVPGAIGQSLVATLLGIMAARWFGWDLQAGIVFGLAISVASTVVLVRVLSDNREMHTPVGHIAVGWLVVEDLFTVVILVLMPLLATKGDIAVLSLPKAIGLALLRIGVFTALTLVVGGKVIPWLLRKVEQTHSRELFTLTILVVALGIAVGAALLFDVSMALGAFLAGMVVGRSDFSLRAATEALPMRDAFAVLFFVSVGMLFEPAHLLDAPWQVAAALAIVLAGKPLAAFIIVVLLRYQVRVAFAVSAALAQIGEFSFILALLGIQLGVLPADAMNTIVAAAMITIALNPLIYKLVGPAEKRLQRFPRVWKRIHARIHSVAEAVAPGDVTPRHPTAIVIGYGPVGRTLTRLLQQNHIEPVIIELNRETVAAVRAEGITAVYGDALHPDVLEQAGITTAFSLMLTSSTTHGSVDIIRTARKLNPAITVLARTNYLRDIPALEDAGAETVYSDEGEIATAMSVAVLRGLGATPEQIDNERERSLDEAAEPALD